jgi:hypothetical protein
VRPATSITDGILGLSSVLFTLTEVTAILLIAGLVIIIAVGSVFLRRGSTLRYEPRRLNNAISRRRQRAEPKEDLKNVVEMVAIAAVLVLPFAVAGSFFALGAFILVLGVLLGFGLTNLATRSRRWGKPFAVFLIMVGAVCLGVVALHPSWVRDTVYGPFTYGVLTGVLSEAVRRLRSN